MIASPIAYLAIDNFPVIILVSIAVAFTFFLLLRTSQVFQKSDLVRILQRRAKHIFILFYGGGYACLFISLGLAAYTYSEPWISMYYISNLLVMILNMVVLGLLVGLIFAVSYTIGVSLFLVVSLCVFSFGLLPLYFDNTDIPLFVFEEFTDFPFLFFWLFPSTDCVTKRMLGIEEPNDDSKNRAVLEVASLFISNCLSVLYERMKTDTDEISHEVHRSLVEKSGPTGDLIRSIKSGEKEVLSPSEIAGSLVSPNQLNYSDFQRRNASKSMNLRPKGSWTLTNAQFSRRVQINRGLYCCSVILLIVIVSTNLPSITLPFSFWVTSISLGLLIASIPLATLDRYFTGKRMSSEMVANTILQSLQGMDEIIESISSKELPIEEEVPPNIHKPPVPTTIQAEVMHDGYIENAPPELKNFLQRVRDNKYSLHEEDILPTYIGAAGIILSAPTLMIFFMLGLFRSAFTIFDLGLLVIGGLGIPLIVFGSVSWYLMTKKRRFRGLRRHWTSIGLSFLDAKENGAKSVGHIIMPPPPRQYFAFNMAGPNAARMLLQHLEETLGEINPKILRDSYETQLRMSKVMIPMFLILGVIFPIMTFGMPEGFRLAFLALSGLIALTGIGMAIDLLRRRRRLNTILDSQGEESLDENDATVDAILWIMRKEYEYPLRLLMSQFHQELVYTGIKYSTNTGHTLHEALFIPSRFLSTLSTIYPHKLDA